MSEWASYPVQDRRAEQPTSTQTAIKQKEPQRQEILNAVEQFKAKGGQITVIPSYVNKDAQLCKMRNREVDLITLSDIAKRWKISTNTISAVMAKWPWLVYITQGTHRVYCLDDIKRLEKQKDYRLHDRKI